MFLCGLGCEALVAQGPFRKATQHKFYAVQLLEGTLLKVDFFFFFKAKPQITKGSDSRVESVPDLQKPEDSHFVFH